jgi:hypothetical protein
MRPDGVQRSRVHRAAHPRAGSQERDPRRAYPESLQGLRTAWRRQSLSAGWLAEDDWWTAAVDAVARAACRDGSLRQACTALGRARAEAGVGITEAMTDVAAREAQQQGTSPRVTHRLGVVELPRRPDPWGRISLVILVGHDLRAAFPGGDTLSLDRPGPAIALVQVTEELAFRFTSLRRTIRAGLGTEARMIRLPARQEDAERLLDGLAH